MAGSTFPFKWTTGVRPLRADLHAMLDATAQTALELGYANRQWAGLRAGQDVTFTTEQLVSWYPNGQESHPSLPPDLTAAGAWTLTGDDALVPAQF